MAMFIGLPCVKCGELFVEGDDIVVCPDCGAPHHRSCYLEEGSCALSHNHADGVSWEPPAGRGGGGEAAAPAGQARSCQSCGGSNPENALFCQYCGHRIDGRGTHIMRDNLPHSQQPPAEPPQEPQQPNHQQSQNRQAPRNNPYQAAYQQYMPEREEALSTPAGPVYPEEVFDGVTAREIAAFIGPNSGYFLTHFKVMKENRRSFSFNWASFLFNYCYYFFRKMYLPGFLLLAAFCGLSIPRLLFSQEYVKYFLSINFDIVIPYDAALIQQLSGNSNRAYMVQILLLVVVSAFCNKLYLGHVVRKIKGIRDSLPLDTSPQAYLAILSSRGRTSLAMGVGIALLTALALFGISFVIASQIVGTGGLPL